MAAPRGALDALAVGLWMDEDAADSKTMSTGKSLMQWAWGKHGINVVQECGLRFWHKQFPCRLLLVLAHWM